DDSKYLAAILIGRKLLFALRASSKEEYEIQMAHLSEFIRLLPEKAPGVFQTQSDNSTYFSLLGLVKNIKEGTFGAELRKEASNRVAQIQQRLDNVQRRCQPLLDEIRRGLLFGTTVLTPAQYD